MNDQVTREQLEQLAAMLAVLDERHYRYCPRCDRETSWWNVVRDGVHSRFACRDCGIEECDMLTETDWVNLRKHRSEQAAA